MKVSDEAKTNVSLYGQEKDATTAGLARMNMILHNNPLAKVMQGNTLSSPEFKAADDILKTFDYVVANPPFSDKRWSNGINPLEDDMTPPCRFVLAYSGCVPFATSLLREKESASPS